MVHVNYPVLNKTEYDSIKKELEERNRHIQFGLNGILDFDSLVQNQRGVILVTQIYLHEINNFRNSRQDVNYLVFFNRGTYPITGASLLAGSLCEKTGLPYAIAHINRQSQTIERTKWGRLCNNTGDLDGEGILLADYINEDKSIKSVSEEVSLRRGKINLVLTYSISTSLEQKLREDLSKKGAELKVLFDAKR